MESPLELKEQANVLYRNKEYQEAIDLYEKSAELADDDLKSICYGNISLCYYNLEDFEESFEYCEKALAIKADYVKVRERKIRILLLQGKVKDAKEELEKGDVAPDLKKEVEEISAKEFEKEKEEMLGKLKDLGNTVLGKFGLSLDSFQVNKSESGGYNINFKNN
ncbi:hypothetical protein SteCoe_18324 [Stentor coeruleus]|uniref:Uncharacterized protein n=1 Tax=Stentor coeruleus TaxID=5963 RepID=A0A1R2BXD1_9CILI|nr:hypothetical protein SteCoe_18324 [Stentor coeruleus]